MMTDWENATEEELLVELDSILYGSKEHLSGRELRAALERSRRWVREWTERHRDELCAEVGRHPLQTNDGLVELATVVDIIMQIGLGHASATVLAAILIKRGIGALCRDSAATGTE
ncbi:hypothetical protein ACIQU4_12105 [Streptomyces sp. NPDC090741]|uniref:hypothetical protein n=1 Tax=Streptomyces sp. NPDC090741 TaxID=3365967 RepID=UPI00382D8E37